MLNDLAHFRNTVVNDSTCENRPQIKFNMSTKRKNGNVMGFRGYRCFHRKVLMPSIRRWELLGPILGAKKPRIILREVRYLSIFWDKFTNYT